MLLVGHRESLCCNLYTSKHVFFLSFGSSQYHILRVGIQFFYQDIHRLVGSGHNTFVQHFLCIGHDFVFFHYQISTAQGIGRFQRNVYSGVTGLAGRECHGRCWRQYGFFHRSVIIRTGSESRQAEENTCTPLV